jgi:folate-binding protein YgfZ
MRIEQGIPSWGHELTNDIIPIEANLEQRAIDYQKGCYIGQEVISRIKMSGQTNKRLCGFLSTTNAPLQAGMRLSSSEDDSKEIGWITSAVRSSRLEKEIALGYVKRGFNSVGTRLLALPSENSASSGSVPIQIVEVPFV